MVGVASRTLTLLDQFVLSAPMQGFFNGVFMLNYAEIRPQLKTGDLIATNPTSRFMWQPKQSPPFLEVGFLLPKISYTTPLSNNLQPSQQRMPNHIS